MNIPLGDTNFVKWIDGGTTYDLDYLVLNGVTIWEKVIEFTPSATFDSSTNKVVYAISGDRVGEFTKWSYRAISREDGADTGEIFVNSGLTFESPTLTSQQNGIWDVTFYGYIGDSIRGTETTTVTVEIFSISFTIAPKNLSTGTITIGSLIGKINTNTYVTPPQTSKSASRYNVEWSIADWSDQIIKDNISGGSYAQSCSKNNWSGTQSCPSWDTVFANSARLTHDAEHVIPALGTIHISEEGFITWASYEGGPHTPEEVGSDQNYCSEPLQPTSNAVLHENGDYLITEEGEFVLVEEA